MPYSIERFGNGYVVVSDNGTRLSKHPLDYETAKRQRTAVNIHEFGGGHRDWYLTLARQKAKKEGLKGDLEYADDGIHKLQIVDPEGRLRRFGRKGYNDYLLWKRIEILGGVPEGYADAKRNTFHRSHEKIKGNWRSDPYSPNNLALKVLW
jgi:hypothetical protein